MLQVNWTSAKRALLLGVILAVYGAVAITDGGAAALCFALGLSVIGTFVRRLDRSGWW